MNIFSEKKQIQEEEEAKKEWKPRRWMETHHKGIGRRLGDYPRGNIRRVPYGHVGRIPLPPTCPGLFFRGRRLTRLNNYRSPEAAKAQSISSPVGCPAATYLGLDLASTSRNLSLSRWSRQCKQRGASIERLFGLFDGEFSWIELLNSDVCTPEFLAFACEGRNRSFPGEIGQRRKILIWFDLIFILEKFGLL